jgi:hypothetical protein
MKLEKLTNIGSGILIIGIAWLIFWLTFAFQLFENDPRWGHNFALPIIFITVGLAYHFNKISCQLVSVFSSFLTVPIFLAFIAWDTGTIIASVLLLLTIILHLIERKRETQIINPKPMLRIWLKIHPLNFAYFGLLHMPLLFFLLRWFNPDPFLTYLPVEHEPSSSIFNFMLIILTPLAIMERYVNKIGRFEVSKIGFFWTILMIILPLISIGVLGH